jgi:uncharacterized protein (TIGR00251 family)
MADLRVRLTPRADRDAIAGVRDGVVQARVSAPPVDGKANQALCKLLAKRLGVPRSRVEIVRGESARDKTVRVVGLDDAEAHERLSGRG